MIRTQASKTTKTRARIITWRIRAHSAVRSALACGIVGVVTLYLPLRVRFPAFSYLTALLIVSADAAAAASLGHTLKGCCRASVATAQVVPLAAAAAALTWTILRAPAGLPIGVAGTAVLVAAFAVALPGFTDIATKKIAFGQIVLLFSEAVADGESRWIPLDIAASTAVGIAASVLAFSIPYPQLAYHQVQKLCSLYAENTYLRMNLYLKAFGEREKYEKSELISQAKPLAETGAKILQSITILEEGLRWEKFQSYPRNGPQKRLHKMEMLMQGIEYSLISSQAFSFQIPDDVLNSILTELKRKLELGRYFYSIENEGEKRRIPLEKLIPVLNHGWEFAYFCCIDMMLHGAETALKVEEKPESRPEKTQFSIVRTFKNCIQKINSSERLNFSLKCSLSLSLAVVFGLIFDKSNGCWAGLTVAINFTEGRQPIFAIANTRIQGTAIGSAYGVICCYLFHHEELRLAALLPWIILATCLSHSKMYGKTGGVSAALGAILILGRKNYGSSMEFAIKRLVEVFIGLTVYLFVEISLRPTRAATLAKIHISNTLQNLRNCIRTMAISPASEKTTGSVSRELLHEQRYLDCQVWEAKKLIDEAQIEPDFWYPPFQFSNYKKIAGSLANIVNLLYLIAYNTELLEELSRTTSQYKELQETQGTHDDNFMDLESGNSQKWPEVELTTKERRIQYLCATVFCINWIENETDEIMKSLREIDQWEE